MRHKEVFRPDHTSLKRKRFIIFGLALLNDLTGTSTVDLLGLSHLTSFNLTVTKIGVLNFAGDRIGPTATYAFGLADLTSFDLVVHRLGNTVFSPGMNGLT